VHKNINGRRGFTAEDAEENEGKQGMKPGRGPTSDFLLCAFRGGSRFTRGAEVV
jgi:hypothetical protein